MRDLILFAMRDFIRKVIAQYVWYLRDIGERESDVEQAELIFQGFENWLYLTMKNS